MGVFPQPGLYFMTLRELTKPLSASSAVSTTTSLLPQNQSSDVFVSMFVGDPLLTVLTRVYRFDF